MRNNYMYRLTSNDGSIESAVRYIFNPLSLLLHHTQFRSSGHTYIEHFRLNGIPHLHVCVTMMIIVCTCT